MSRAARPDPASSLPHPRTPLVGRAHELATARALLVDEAVPLLTLTGPGGVGKTRLALAVAHDVASSFADGAVFVDLAPVRDPALALAALAQAIGIRDAGNRPLADRVAAFLKPRQLLLLLDNCEQVLDAAPAIADLLAICPALQVLGTSRAPLRLRGEHLLPVPPLAVPDSAAPPPLPALAATEAVALFLQRARAADPAFTLIEANAAAVTEVVRRLDGLPLALELAAARLRALSVEALLAQLIQRLRVLTEGERDRPDRQRTLRAAIAWSYDLLPPGERALFRRLSVFAGGFDAGAAGMVAGDEPLAVLDGLQALVDQSLLARVAGPGGSPRWMSLETVREFGLEQLAAHSEEPAARRAHVGYVLALAEDAAPHLMMPNQDAWVARLEAEHDNLRAALAWLEQAGEAEAMLRLAGALARFWLVRAHLAEGRGWLGRALALAGSAAPAALRASALGEEGVLAFHQGDYQRAEELVAPSLALWRALGDTEQVALGLFRLGLVFRNQDRYAEAVARTEEALALFDDLDDVSVTAAPLASLVLSCLGGMVYEQGQYARAGEYLAEALARQRAMSYDWATGSTLFDLGRLARDRGEVAEAAARFRESLEFARSLDDPFLAARALARLADVALVWNQPVPATRLLAAVAALDEVMGGTTFPPERLLEEQTRATARAALGEVACAATWAAGRALAMDEAITEALALAPPADGSVAVGTAGSSPAGPRGAPAPRDPFGLTKREREVLVLLAQRYTDPEIAQALFISPRTASGHVANLFGKLGVGSRRQAAAVAARLGLV